MSKKNILKPIETFRTPEEHRAIIQAQSTVELKVKLPKFKNMTLEDGTHALSGRILRLGFKKYSEYLLSTHWYTVKQQWQNSDLFKGWICSTENCSCVKGLALHHWTYIRLGDEQLTDLILVCSKCHKQIHKLERKGMSLKEATEFVVGYSIDKRLPT